MIARIETAGRKKTTDTENGNRWQGGLASSDCRLGEMHSNRHAAAVTASHPDKPVRGAIMPLNPSQWTAALTLAVSLHVALGLVLVRHTAEIGAQAPGLGGLEIALGPAGGAAAAQQYTEAVSAVAEAQTVEISPALPEPQAQATPHPFQLQPVPDSTTNPPVEDDNKMIDKYRLPTTSKTTLAKTSIALPTAKHKQSSTSASAGGRAGAAQSVEAGTHRDDTSAGGLAGIEADYATILLAWLERHKKYPHAARTRRQEGVARLMIAIGRNGEVLEGRIEQSTGHPLLDRATLDMLARAEPLPPLPPAIAGERFDVVVPVHFVFRRRHRLQ